MRLKSFPETLSSTQKACRRHANAPGRSSLEISERPAPCPVNRAIVAVVASNTHAGARPMRIASWMATNGQAIEQLAPPPIYDVSGDDRRASNFWPARYRYRPRKVAYA